MNQTMTKWIALTAFVLFGCVVLHGLNRWQTGLSLGTTYHMPCGSLAQCINHHFTLNFIGTVKKHEEGEDEKRWGEPMTHGERRFSPARPPADNTQGRVNMCPQDPPNLIGEVPLNKSYIPIPEFEQTLLEYVETGGRSDPSDCMANHRVAIIVPFRDRHEHLAVLLRHLHPILHRQQLDYRIFIVEQTEHAKFNKGLLFNAGVLEISNRYPDRYQCIVLQDVDILPLNDNILYQCTERPNHLSVFIDRYDFQYMGFATGGVLELSTEQYREVNGFSNLFYGWGGEDDDFHCRLHAKKLAWTEHKNSWAKWGNLGHEHGTRNPGRVDLLKSCRRRQDIDGLTSSNYSVKDYRELALYTNITIEVPKLTVFNGTDYF